MVLTDYFLGLFYSLWDNRMTTTLPIDDTECLKFRAVSRIFRCSKHDYNVHTLIICTIPLTANLYMLASD